MNQNPEVTLPLRKAEWPAEFAKTIDLVTDINRYMNERNGALAAALNGLLDAQDPLFCQGEVYNEGLDEQLDCGFCPWCRARTALGRPEVAS